MPKRKASLVINPHGGQNLAHLPGVLSVLTAAEWKTRLAIKEYGGQAQNLAQKAAERGCNLLIAYGGDGTLNQVVNGAMHSGYQGIVGVIPGGTANVWAAEVGIPADPIKASLTLVQSVARPVDIGHVAVTTLTFPAMASSNGEEVEKQEPREKKHKDKARANARQHFLLMAGLGIDAAIMSAVSKPLKYRLGPLAVGLAAVKEIPEQRPFPLEVRSTAGANRGQLLWKGDALQVIIGNTRLYAKVAEMTPAAMIDDGLLDVCVITAGEPLTTLEQLTSLLLRRTPAPVTAQYVRGAQLSLRVPAFVPLQVDGSAVKWTDYLGPRDRERLQQTGHLHEGVVTYQFDALPRALHLAIPREYDDTLFQHPQDSMPAEGTPASHREELPEQNRSEQPAAVEHVQPDSPRPSELQELVKVLAEGGRTVKVLGVSAFPAREHTVLLAGNTLSRKTGEIKPVTLCVNEKTLIVDRTGQLVSLTLVKEIEEGKEVIVAGKKNKRGVIKSTCLLI